MPSKSLGYYVQIIVAASHGIGAKPIPLAEIDIGLDFTSLEHDLDYFRRAPDELSVEKSIVWAALTLYCLARCTNLGKSSGIASAPLSAIELKRLAQGADFWRLREVGGGAFAQELAAKLGREGEPSPGITEEVSIEAPVIELEELASEGRLHRLKVRLSPDCTWDRDVTLSVDIKLLSRPDHEVAIALVDAPQAVLRDGKVTIRIGDDWQIVTFRVKSSYGRTGVDTVSMQLIGVTGWKAACPLLRVDATSDEASLFCSLGTQPDFSLPL